MITKKFRCIICGRKIESSYSHNPSPIVPYGRCCERCNLEVVLPARIKLAVNKKEEGD